MGKVVRICRGPRMFNFGHNKNENLLGAEFFAKVD